MIILSVIAFPILANASSQHTTYIMDSRANLSPTKTTNAKARPEVVRVRQLETASALVDRSVGCQYLNSGPNGVPMTSKQQTRRNSPMRANSMESVMV